MKWSHSCAGNRLRKPAVFLAIVFFSPTFLLAQCFGTESRSTSGSGSFDVPDNAQYFIIRITAEGADGGDYTQSQGGTGGSGAKMVAEFLIKGGTELEYYVGGFGKDGDLVFSPRAGGGGGGTAVILKDGNSRVVLVAAGAGGGSGGSSDYPGLGGGGVASLATVPAGGTSSGYAAGGGGFLWPGEDGFAGSTGGSPGTLDGGMGNGGQGGGNAGDGGRGFGGGGGGAAQLGGGGGGYRGGNGGGRDENNQPSFWGKGGYSFITQSPVLQVNPVISLIEDGVAGAGQGRDGSVTIECVSALPVEMVSFKGRQHPKGVSLDWTTSAEVNNEGFAVEHSEDGILWKKVGFVAGKGTTSVQQSYQFLHDQPLSGLHYYRLKQMDYDGAFEYSEVISVLLENTERLEYFPNPTSGQLTLNGPDVEGAWVQISDSFGKLVRKMQVKRRSLDLSDLPAGVYLLNIDTGEKKFLKRIIKE
jgi:hypothetical protein